MAADQERPPVPVEKFHLAYHPRLKLFLSADIVGSTAFKQPFDINSKLSEENILRLSVGQDGAPLQPWPIIIQSYYQQFHERMVETWDGYRRDLEESRDGHKFSDWFGTPPQLWKTVGDEVIYWKEITHDVQVATTISCWMKIVNEIRIWLKDIQKTNLDVKCTAWAAEFPVRNRAIWSEKTNYNRGKNLSAKYKMVDPVEFELSSPNESDGFKRLDSQVSEFAIEELNNFYADIEYNGVIDFIGPGIDIGFRVASWSSAQRFALSLDVAYLLAITMDIENPQSPIKALPRTLTDRWASVPEGQAVPGEILEISTDDPDVLKGVLGGIKYPKFWIDMKPLEDTLLFHEKELNGKDSAKKMSAIKAYCSKYYEVNSAYLMPPFINIAKTVTIPLERYEKFLDVVGERITQVALGD